MKALLPVAAGLFVLAAVPAGAADMALPAKAPVAVYNWTGFYFGGNVGYGDGEDSVSTSSTLNGAAFGAPFAFETKSSGFFGGGQAGFNYELPTNFVIGVEADGDWSGITGNSSTCPSATNCSFHKNSLEDFGTVRGRLGYAWNNVLVYGTGGWAWGEGKVTTTLGPTFIPVGLEGVSTSVTPNLSGWTAGAGLEVGLLSFPGWTVRLEYLHLEFDNVANTFTFTGTGAPPPVLVSSSTANVRFDMLQFGVNYLFNWGPAPIMARY